MEAWRRAGAGSEFFSGGSGGKGLEGENEAEKERHNHPALCAMLGAGVSGCPEEA